MGESEERVEVEEVGVVEVRLQLNFCHVTKKTTAPPRHPLSACTPKVVWGVIDV